MGRIYGVETAVEQTDVEGFPSALRGRSDVYLSVLRQ